MNIWIAGKNLMKTHYQLKKPSIANYLIFLKIYHFYSKEKVKKLICSIEDKEKYVIHVRALKQALNHELTLKKVHRVIQLKQEAWLKAYIDMNTELRKKAKNEFEKKKFLS